MDDSTAGPTASSVRSRVRTAALFGVSLLAGIAAATLAGRVWIAIGRPTHVAELHNLALFLYLVGFVAFALSFGTLDDRLSGS